MSMETRPSILKILAGIPKLIAGQVLYPLLNTLRSPMPEPETQAELADLVNRTRIHEIRAGFEHRFIRLMFVTVDDRVFCRQYQFGARSWRDVFLRDPAGQVRLDSTVATIEARELEDYESIIPAVDKAYERDLDKLGASYMIPGAVAPRSQQSTMEIFLADGPVSAG